MVAMVKDIHDNIDDDTPLCRVCGSFLELSAERAIGTHIWCIKSANQHRSVAAPTYSAPPDDEDSIPAPI